MIEEVAYIFKSTLLAIYSNKWFNCHPIHSLIITFLFVSKINSSNIT